MKAYLIDPYQRRVHSIEIEKGLPAWYKVLDCEHVDVARVATLPNGRQIDVWVDDEGLLLEPVPPTFRLCGHVLAGYGLALECDLRNGESYGVSFPVNWFYGKLSFEKWEDRLDSRDYFEQLTRYLVKA